MQWILNRWRMGLMALAGLAGMAIVSPAANGGLLETQSNVSAAVSADPYNLASWASVPTYPVASGDATASEDLNFISIAHDNSWLYIRMNVSGTTSFGGDWNLWMDTDQNASTGTRNWDGNLSIGAEELLTGAALIDNIPAWNVNWEGWAFFDNGSNQDAIIAIDRTLLGGATSFDFVGEMYNNSVGAVSDWYPGNALNQSGDYYRYSLVPEPASIGLLALGSVVLLRRRRLPIV